MAEGGKSPPSTSKPPVPPNNQEGSSTDANGEQPKQDEPTRKRGNLDNLYQILEDKRELFRRKQLGKRLKKSLAEKRDQLQTWRDEMARCNMRRRAAAAERRRHDECLCTRNNEPMARLKCKFKKKLIKSMKPARHERRCGDRLARSPSPISRYVHMAPAPEDITPPREQRVPRHCMSPIEYLDFLSTPSRRQRAQAPCAQSSPRECRLPRPISPWIEELALPHPRRVMHTIENHGEVIPRYSLVRLILTIEDETALTPEQAEEAVRAERERQEQIRFHRWTRAVAKRETEALRREIMLQSSDSSGDASNACRGRTRRRRKRKRNGSTVPGQEDSDESESGQQPQPQSPQSPRKIKRRRVDEDHYVVDNDETQNEIAMVPSDDDNDDNDDNDDENDDDDDLMVLEDEPSDPFNQAFIDLSSENDSAYFTDEESACSPSRNR